MAEQGSSSMFAGLGEWGDEMATAFDGVQAKVGGALKTASESTGAITTTSGGVESPKGKGTASRSPRGNALGVLNQRIAWTGSQLRPRMGSPSVTLGGNGLATGARFNKGASARLVLLAMGVGGAFIIVGGKNFRPYKSTVIDSKGETKDVQVPGTLHAFTGLVIAGTVALVVNEISPELGVVFAFGLAVIAWGNAQAYESLGNVLLGKGQPVPAKTTQQILDSIPGGSVVPQADGSQLVKPNNGKPYILRKMPNGEWSQEPIPKGVVIT